MTGAVATAAPGDALPPQTGTAPAFAFTSTTCPTCGRCPTCGHPVPLLPAQPWPYPWWGIYPPLPGPTCHVPCIQVTPQPPNTGSGWTPAP